MNTQKMEVRTQGGFTLIELLVVIGIIAILAAVVIIAINPAKQFAQARNAQRESNVATILNAIGQNIADNKGVFSTAGGCDALPVHTSTSSAETIGTGSGNIDLSCLTPTYIPAGIPFDPNGGADANTKYAVMQDAIGRVTVCSPEHNESPVVPGSAEYCQTR